jgi:hypothetical protein
VAEIFRGGGKGFKFPTSPPPPPFALEKTVFSPLLIKISENSSIFRKVGGGGRKAPRPTKIPPLLLQLHGFPRGKILKTEVLDREAGAVLKNLFLNVPTRRPMFLSPRNRISLELYFFCTELNIHEFPFQIHKERLKLFDYRTNSHMSKLYRTNLSSSGLR